MLDKAVLCFARCFGTNGDDSQYYPSSNTLGNNDNQYLVQSSSER